MEDRNFLETLEIWVVRLRGHFGYNDNFTLETLKAGVVEKVFFIFFFFSTLFFLIYSEY